MPKCLFVTATGTEVGKTHVVCQLVQQLRAQDRKVRAIKPVISGLREGVEPSDTGRILRAMGMELSPTHVEAVSPFRFQEPLSPDMAAHREGTRIDVQAILQHYHKTLEGLGHDDILLVEGVGGAFVPLNDTELVTDWMLALQIPVVVVCGSYLGTLSHTIATVRAMLDCGVPLRALVISESPSSPVPLSETRDSLRRFISLPIELCPRAEPSDLTSLLY